jgi:peptide/nickel transport system substrate-binding protein
MTRRRFALVMGLVLLAAAPVGSAAQETPKAGGTLRVALSAEPITLNPGISNSQFDTFVTSKIFEGLVYVDERLQPLPGLAESWSAGPNDKTWTFHLRRNVKWHDGKPFTSTDVKFTIEQVLLPLHPLGRTTLAGIEAVETPDAHTVVLRLKAPSVLLAPPFIGLNALSASIVPRHVYEGTDIRSHKANLAPIGTGPFKFKEWIKGSHIILTRNEGYWQRGRPYLDEVIVRVMPDVNARLLSLSKGDVDYVPFGVSYAAIPRFEHQPTVRVERFKDARYMIHGLYFNVRKPPFDKVAVRQAIAHAVDKEAVVRTVTFRIDRPATALQPSASPYHNAAVESYPLNVERAKELLDAAGVRPGPDGVRVKATYSVDLGIGETAVKTAELVRDQLRKIGIELTVVPMDRAAFLDKVYARFDFDLGSFFGTMGPDPAAMEKWFATLAKAAPFTNPTGYANPTVDGLLRDGAGETNLAKRKRIYDQVQLILSRDLPYLPIREDSSPQLVRSVFRNVPGDIFVGRTDRLVEAWTTGGR